MADDRLMDLTQDRTMLRALYSPPKETFSTVEVPMLPFAILDGEDTPEQEAVGAAAKALYTAIYPIRREARERMGRSFVEAPLEVLYWSDDMRDLAEGRRDKWKWRVQITLPVWANAERLEASVSEMCPELGDKPILRWEAVTEGKCVQILHVGKTSDLPVVLENVYCRYLPQEGLEPTGAYHEIYLDDWSRTAPEKRKIVVRQPVKRIQKQ